MKKIAVVGATGLTGGKLIEILNGEKKYDVDFYASDNSLDKSVIYKGEKIKVKSLSDCSKFKTDLAFFCVENSISKVFVPIFAKNGALCIDNSSQFRMDDNVPLIVPEINLDKIRKKERVIANPNCSTIQIVLPLYIIDKFFGLKQTVISTYQSVSGAGKSGLEQLNREMKGENIDGGFGNSPFVCQIFDNCIPQIDEFDDAGNTKEELKVINESRKILGKPNLAVSCTAVRVAVSVGHGASVFCDCENKADISVLEKAFCSQSGLKYFSGKTFPTPLSSREKGDICVGRLRKDKFNENALSFWVCADNLLKGAALNMWQISRGLCEKGYV